MPTAKSSDGVAIAYQVAGSGNPTLVFVHGWCCDRSYWDAQVPYFARQYQVVTVDLAGHGDSGLNRDTWTTRTFGDDVVAVVKELGLKQIVLISHSIGGEIIAEAALRMPQRVIGLVGVDTYHEVEPSDSLEQTYRNAAPTPATFPALMRTHVKSMFTPDSDPALAARVIADMSSAPPEIGLGVLRMIVEARKQGIATAFDQLKVPIRSICAARGPVNVESARRHAPSFQAKYMSGVGHFVMMEDPATFNRLLDETVKEIVSHRKSAA
jgi:pimeloyl-ACP methyl ester carboxylesterase